MAFYSFFPVFILLRKKVVLPGALRCGIFQLIAIHNLLDLKSIDPWSMAAFPIIKLLILAFRNICAMTSYKPSAAHMYTYERIQLI